MVDDIEEAEDERMIELSTISAIYPELNIDPSDPFSASIEIKVEPAKPVAVRFLPVADGAPVSGLVTPPTSDKAKNVTLSTEGSGLSAVGEGHDHEVYRFSYLPPLNLEVRLQDGYPTEQPPSIQLSAQLPWIPEKKLEELSAAGLSIWEQTGRDQVLFSYLDFLREAAENVFDLVPLDSDGFLKVSQPLKIALLDFDRQAKRAKFEQQTFECGVCLEPKKGSVCHQLVQCSHVFCVGCLQDFFNACIAEGDVTNVKCMAPECGKDTKDVSGNNSNRQRKRRRKKDRCLDPSELLQIPLSEDTVQRYMKLRRKQKLESDRTTIYCPRQWCQGPARSKKSNSVSNQSSDSDIDSESDDPRVPSKPLTYNKDTPEDVLPPPSERLAICEDCTFAFCKVCKAGWHGEFFACFPRRAHELTAEEKASEDYIKIHTTPCPTCNARCQKTMGCNHMICFKCNSHFCYLCSRWLDADNPYKHFNNNKSPCYMRLWELEEGDGADIAPEFDEEEHQDHARPQLLRIPPALQGEELPQRPVPAPNARQEAPPPPAPEPVPRGRRARIQAGLQRADIIHPEPLQGLQRFLQMARDDVEDEWDSDEMGDEDEELAVFQ